MVTLLLVPSLLANPACTYGFSTLVHPTHYAVKDLLFTRDLFTQQALATQALEWWRTLLQAEPREEILKEGGHLMSASKTSHRSLKRGRWKLKISGFVSTVLLPAVTLAQKVPIRPNYDRLENPALVLYTMFVTLPAWEWGMIATIAIMLLAGLWDAVRALQDGIKRVPKLNIYAVDKPGQKQPLASTISAIVLSLAGLIFIFPGLILPHFAKENWVTAMVVYCVIYAAFGLFFPFYFSGIYIGYWIYKMWAKLISPLNFLIDPESTFRKNRRLNKHGGFMVMGTVGPIAAMLAASSLALPKLLPLLRGLPSWAPHLGLGALVPILGIPLGLEIFGDLAALIQPHVRKPATNLRKRFPLFASA